MTNITEEIPKKIQARIIINLSSSPFKAKSTINSKRFNAIPEKPCPAENATIKSIGK